MHNFCNISPDKITDISDLVSETNFHSKKAVSTVFDHLCTSNVSRDKRYMSLSIRSWAVAWRSEALFYKWFVQFFQLSSRKIFICSDNYAICIKSIEYRRTLSKKLWIRGYVEIKFRISLLDEHVDPVSRAYGDGRFIYNDTILLSVFTDSFSASFDITQIRLPILLWRSTDCDKNYFPMLHSDFRVSGEYREFISFFSIF